MSLPTRAPWRVAALAVAALLPILPCSAAQAAVTTSTFNVTADVLTSCFINDNNLNFGAYSGVQLDGTTTLTATCSNGTPYTIGLTQGIGLGASVSSRKLTGPGTDILNYTLSQDAAHTVPWGNTIGTDTQAGTGNGAAQSFTVFGRIPGNQFVAGGAYSDTITVTLTF